MRPDISTRPNIDGALRRALEQPTLLAALTWMAEWESERIVGAGEEGKYLGLLLRPVPPTGAGLVDRAQGFGRGHLI